MRRHRILKATLLLAGALAGASLFASPATAGEGGLQGYGSVSNGQISASAASSSPGNTASDPSGTGGSGSGPACPFIPLPAAYQAALGQGGPTPGEWYVISCGGPLIIQSTGVYWFPTGQAPGTPPSVQALLQQALTQAALIEPSVVLDPPGKQIVNEPSWLAINPGDWHAVVASASAGAVTATVTANPEAVVWNTGDGHGITCPGPGVIYDASEPATEQSTYCAYTWTTSSAGEPGGAYTLTATIEYEVTTAVAGAADPTPDLGAHPGPSAEEPVVVSEVEALGTSP